MPHTVFNPMQRNISANGQIEALFIEKAEYVRQAMEKQLELDVLNSKISSIEAEVANIMMNKPRRAKKDKEKML